LIDLIGPSADACGCCLSLGYLGCLELTPLGGPSPNPFLHEDGPIDLLMVESTGPIDEHSKFRGWGDWETLMKEPMHSAILAKERAFWQDMYCTRLEKGDATISEYTLSGKSSFR
jgi:hypothetical protein